MIVIIPIGLIICLIQYCIRSCENCKRERQLRRDLERGDMEAIITEQPIVPPAYSPAWPYSSGSAMHDCIRVFAALCSANWNLDLMLNVNVSHGVWFHTLCIQENRVFTVYAHAQGCKVLYLLVYVPEVALWAWLIVIRTSMHFLR